MQFQFILIIQYTKNYFDVLTGSRKPSNDQFGYIAISLKIFGSVISRCTKNLVKARLGYIGT